MIAAYPAAHRAGITGTLAAHAVAVVGAIVIASRDPEPQPMVYAVNLVAAPAPGPRPRRAAEAAVPTQTDNNVAPVEAPRRTPEPPPPAPRDTPRRDDPALVTKSDSTPNPGERPSTGHDALTFAQEGIRFQYPEYLNNIVNQIHRRWANPIRGASRLKTEIAFTIQRDGTVTDIEYGTKSNVYQFDISALGAVTKAGTERAFGPLPGGYNGESLPIVFSFTPRTP